MDWRTSDLVRDVDRIAIAIAITRPDGTVQYANRYLREMLGVDPGEPLDAALALLKSTTGLLLKSGNDAGKTRGDEVRVESDGDARDLLYAVYPLRDDGKAITHYAHFFQDLRDVRRQNSLAKLAFYDQLTGLPNRNLFSDRLAQALMLAKRNETAFVLLYIDIDHFKRFNDSYGHETGDALLREVAARMAKTLRGSDTLARWGGDEFVALLDGVADRKSAARIAAKLIAASAQPYVACGHECRVTLSIGASFYPRDGQNASTLLHRADAAMYEVKSGGRNGYRVEQPAHDYPLPLA